MDMNRTSHRVCMMFLLYMNAIEMSSIFSCLYFLSLIFHGSLNLLSVMARQFLSISFTILHARSKSMRFSRLS